MVNALAVQSVHRFGFTAGTGQAERDGELTQEALVAEAKKRRLLS